jgi:hypothetical protein
MEMGMGGDVEGCTCVVALHLQGILRIEETPPGPVSKSSARNPSPQASPRPISQVTVVIARSLRKAEPQHP